MRCKACDVLLSNFEATRKIRGTHEYLDLCNACFKPVSSSVDVEERTDLATYKELFDDPEDEEET